MDEHERQQFAHLIAAIDLSAAQVTSWLRDVEDSLANVERAGTDEVVRFIFASNVPTAISHAIAAQALCDQLRAKAESMVKSKSCER